MLPPVKKRIHVPLSPQRAFDLFTGELNSWWPKERHSVSAMEGKTSQNVALEPGLGGKLTEICADGSEAEWATVTAWEPGKRFTMDWYVGRTRDEATQVDIRFLPNADGTTVELTHTGWEVFAEKATVMRKGYNGGWNSVMAQLTAAASRMRVNA